MLQRGMIVLVLAACAGKSEEPAPAPVPQIIADAGVDGITTIGGFDPDSGMHLDDDTPNGRTPAAKKVKGAGTPFGIMLKSTPSPALVFVDGENLGQTPKYWSGVTDGSEHEFAFVRPGYALARYKFVPVTSGTLHATLTQISSDPLDAGLDPLIAPKFAPDASVAPPPTILTPVDAAVPRVEIDAAVGSSAPSGPTP